MILFGDTSFPCQRVLPKRARGFTLVELLVVITMGLILMTLSVFAVKGVGKSVNLVNAGQKISATIQLARQQAMTNNTLTAILFLKQLGTTEDYRALTVVSYDSKLGWQQTSAWEVLPDGILINETSSIFQNSSFPLPFTQGSSGPSFKFQNRELTNQYATRVFLPTGAILNPESEAQIELVEGFRHGAVQTLTNATDSVPNDKMELTIIGVTGRVKTYRP